MDFDFDLPPPPSESDSAPPPVAASNPFLERAAKFGLKSQASTPAKEVKDVKVSKPDDDDLPPSPHKPPSSPTASSVQASSSPTTFYKRPNLKASSSSSSSSAAPASPAAEVRQSNPYAASSSSSSSSSAPVNPYSRSGAAVDIAPTFTLGSFVVSSDLPPPPEASRKEDVSSKIASLYAAKSIPASSVSAAPAQRSHLAPASASASASAFNDDDLPPPPGDDDLPPPPSYPVAAAVAPVASGGGGGAAAKPAPRKALPPPPEDPEPEQPSEKKAGLIERMRQLNMSARDSGPAAGSSGAGPAAARPVGAGGGASKALPLEHEFDGVDAAGDPLLRMKQQKPTGPPRGHCGVCGGLIYGSEQALELGADLYHPRCFVCHRCSKPLTGQMLTIQGKFYHPGCLTCKFCHVSLSNKQIAVNPKDHQLYCVDHARGGPPGMLHSKAESGRCGGCGVALNPAERQIPVPQLSAKFHPHCFTCQHCQTPMEGKQVVVHESKIYCEPHFDQLFRTKCAACSQVISGGNVMEVEGENGVNLSFHATCFRCITCKKSLKGVSFFLKQNQLCCEAHAQ